MRIAMFSDSFYPELGGIQDSVLTSARELGVRGHNMIIFAPAAARRDYVRANVPIAEVSLGRNVKIRRITSLPFPSSTLQSRLVIPTGRRWRDLAQFQPDIIHTHTFLGAGLEALIAARQLQVPLVGTNHWAVGEFSIYAPVGKAAFRRMSTKAVARYYNQCDWVTGPSRSVVLEMQAHGLRKPHAVISNPIDTSVFRPAPVLERRCLKAEMGFSEATVLYAGRLAREKCIDVLIRAVAALRTDVPEVMLVLVGHGSARRQLEILAQELGVAQQVRFVGTVSHSVLAKLYHAADVFAIASTSETQSMVLLQAMSAGLPVVGARRGGLLEYIPREAGMLAVPGGSLDFAEKLRRILTDRSLQESMRNHAALFARSFSVPAVIDAWEGLYAQVAQGVTFRRPLF